MKLDYFHDYEVQDMVFGARVTYVICTHKQTGKQSLYGYGSNYYGQLGHKDLKKTFYTEPVEMIGLFLKNENERIIKVTCGVYHTMVQTSSNLYALGKASRGQLGAKYAK